jgi:nicotinate dehydrogenase subunit A
MRMTVNGSDVDIDIGQDTPLIYLLRNNLHLKSVRFGCGAGDCGACLVLIDGRPLPSCDTPSSAAAGKSVTTVEGLRDHPLIAALLAEQAAQCGYCISGMVISAVALLERNPSPDQEAIRAALEPNLCRCGVHNRVIRAVLQV